MKIEKSYWATAPLFGTSVYVCIGVVLGVDEVTGQRKGYIGITSGDNEKSDEEFIAQYGQKVSPVIVKGILDYLEPTRK